MSAETLGQRLNRLMEDQNAKPSVLARGANISRMTLWQMRNDKIRDHRITTIEKIASSLNVEPRYLLYGDEDH